MRISHQDAIKWANSLYRELYVEPKEKEEAEKKAMLYQFNKVLNGREIYITSKEVIIQSRKKDIAVSITNLLNQ